MGLWGKHRFDHSFDQHCRSFKATLSLGRATFVDANSTRRKLKARMAATRRQASKSRFRSAPVALYSG
jgi:hypothetical protein